MAIGMIRQKTFQWLRIYIFNIQKNVRSDLLDVGFNVLTYQ